MSDKEIMALKAARAALYKQAETGQRYCTKTGSMYFGEAAGIIEEILIREQQEPPEEMLWRRFDLCFDDGPEKDELYRLLDRLKLSRRELALIVAGLRIRAEFSLEDF